MRHNSHALRAIPHQLSIDDNIDNIDPPPLSKHRAFCLVITIVQLDLDPSAYIETVAEPLPSCCTSVPTIERVDCLVPALRRAISSRPKSNTAGFPMHRSTNPWL
jgi:hypothetical protein